MTFFATGSSSALAQRKLRLVSARNNVQASFTGSQSIYADESRIFLASAQGKLIVLARDRRANFPILQVVADTEFPLTAVRGDSTHLYVTAADGELRIYLKHDSLRLLETVSLSSFGLNAISLDDDTVYLAKGQAAMGTNSANVFISALNEGETVLGIAKHSLKPKIALDLSNTEHTTVIVDKRSGTQLGKIKNPLNLFGTHSATNLYVDNQILVQTTPGCSGSGIFIYNPKSLLLRQHIDRPFTNTAARWGHWLIAGNEAGYVDLFDLWKHPTALVSTVDLRRATGHRQDEDIEIRALWKDNFDNLVFAASSWGNDWSRSEDLPSFFVLELVGAMAN